MGHTVLETAGRRYQHYWQLRLAAHTWALVQGRYLLCSISAHLLWGHQVAAKGDSSSLSSSSKLDPLPGPNLVLCTAGAACRDAIFSHVRDRIYRLAHTGTRMLAVLTPKGIVDEQLQQTRPFPWRTFGHGQRRDEEGRGHGAHTTAQERLVGKGIPEQIDMAGGSVTWCTC